MRNVVGIIGGGDMDGEALIQKVVDGRRAATSRCVDCRVVVVDFDTVGAGLG